MVEQKIMTLKSRSGATRQKAAVSWTSEAGRVKIELGARYYTFHEEAAQQVTSR